MIDCMDMVWTEGIQLVATDGREVVSLVSRSVLVGWAFFSTCIAVWGVPLP